MALSIEIEIKNTKDAIFLIDSTGDYNSVTNITGWGTPNSAHTTPSPVSAITLDIYLPGSTNSIGQANILGTTFFTSTDRAYDLVSDSSSVIPAFDLQDGVWKFITTFTISSVQYQIVTYALRDISLKCSIGQLALGDMDVNNFDEIKTMYDKMVQAFDCGEYILAQDLYEEINDMLSDCGPTIKGCGC